MAPLRTSDRMIWHERSAIAVVHVYGFAAGGVPFAQPSCSRSYSSSSGPASAWVKPQHAPGVVLKGLKPVAIPCRHGRFARAEGGWAVRRYPALSRRRPW